MTINEVIYFEVTCNELGCKERSNDDYAAWSERDVAQQDAEEAGWYWDESTGEHWCTKHKPYCDPGKHVRNYEDDRCTRCGQWPEDDEEMARP